MIFSRVLPLVLVAASSLQAQVSEADALVVYVVPDVVVIRGRDTLAASVGLTLSAGDRLAVAAGGRAVIVRASGRSETFTSSATISAATRSEPGGLVRNTLALLGQMSTDARMQPNRAAMIRPIAGAAVAISPRNGITVLDLRPTFVWFAATSRPYTVQLARKHGVPLRFTDIQDTVWTLPDSELPLLAGAEYEWTVTAGVGGRTPTAVTFRAISSAELAVLTRHLESLSAEGLDFEKEGLLLAAAAYLEAGLVYDALHALERLLAGSVSVSAEIRELHRSLRERALRAEGQ